MPQLNSKQERVKIFEMRNVQSKFNYTGKLFENELFTTCQKLTDSKRNQHSRFKIPFSTFSPICNCQETAAPNIFVLVPHNNN